MERLAGRLAAAAATAALVLGACTSPDSPPAPVAASDGATWPPALAPFYEQVATWRDCADGFECAVVTVPIDYDDPEGPSTSLEVARLPAALGTGSLIVGNDDPGESGIARARALRAGLPTEVLSRFDVVGVGARGVGGSAPVDCVEDAELDALRAADWTPDDLAEVDALTALATDVALGCQSRSAQLAPHVDSESSARDLDIIRTVLGDEQLTYLATGYSTLIGAQYAELFPERVGRMVLDGPVPNSLGADELALGRGRAAEATLRRFVTDCSTRAGCPLPTDADEGMARIRQLLTDLDSQPLSADDGRVLTEALATHAIRSQLALPPEVWSALDEALADALAGDGTALLGLSDLAVGRDSAGRYADNRIEASLTTSCLDRPAEGGGDYALSQAEIAQREAPILGPHLVWGNLLCWQWPFGPENQPVNDPPVLRAEGSAPILVVSTTRDPAIAPEWGPRVADELADATLLIYDAERRGGYPSGTPCVDGAVDRYLVEGLLPIDGAVCPWPAPTTGPGT